MAFALMLASCAGVPRADFTEEEQGIAEIPGMPGVRFFADAPARTVAGVLGKDAILQATRENNGRFEMLALSGGAWDGAYGAGILNGWTQTGSRPKFVVVTGVSAGALIAPLAFMGPEYDTALKDAFTSGIADPLSDGTDNLLAVVGERGARRDALRALVSSFVDEKFLQAVAAGHKRGRRLLIVTTNLDAQRTVVWNMGAIASYGDARALELFRDVLTASCSVPGVFEPTRIAVTAGSRQFEELHVDGGVTANVFMLPDSLLTSGANRPKMPGSIYVVMNTTLAPEFEVQQVRVSTMVGRSLSTLLKAHSKTTVLASMEFARSAGISFYMTHIKEEIPKNLKPGFNKEYMRVVYALGYNRAVTGNFWEKTVPASQRR
jgi:predicted acylesterase/phospholipase RssA